MKKLFFCAAALFAAISFSACSDDDENLPVTSGSIVGTWQIVHEEGWDIDHGEKHTWSEDYPDEDGSYWTSTFDKNGTWTETFYEYDNSEVDIYYETGSYSISGNTIIMKETYASYTVEIRKLTKSELVLHESHEESDYSFEETFTFKRIE